MQTKRVLIDGGTGFFAYWMNQTCPDGIDPFSIGHDYINFSMNYWKSVSWDAIVHLAPIAPTEVLEYAKKHNTRVLFASSGAVYEGVGEYADNKRAWEMECI